MSSKRNKMAQIVQPNFAFKWDSKSKPTAKATVFARRKRKSAGSSTTIQSIGKPAEQKPSTIKSEQPTKPKPAIIISKPLTNDTQLQNSSAGQASTPEIRSLSSFNNNGPIGHIKRKQKKDKLLAKQLIKEGKQNEVKLNSDGPNYNLFSVKYKYIHVNTAAGKSVSEKVFTGCAFKEMDIHPHLVSNLKKHGFLKATNVQSKAIPVIVTGKNTLVRSQTGSGKTLAYAVPIIDALQGIQPKLKRTDGMQAIIVVPTRELALQVDELFSKINTFQWLVVNHLCGGESRKTEKDRIKKGMNVVIGTPGRLLDHVLHTAAMQIGNVRCLVLDEADRLLDMGFRKDIVSLVEALDKSKSSSDYDPMKMFKSSADKTDDDTTDGIPSDTSDGDVSPLKDINSKSRQNIMLSATLTKAVSELASFTMKDHTYIDALDLKSNAVADSYVIPDTVQQEFIMTHAKHRLFTLSALLLAKSKLPACKLFVFMASTQMVDFHYELFSKHLARMPINRGRANQATDNDSDDDADEVVMDTEIFKLHGSMKQKERKAVFKGFREAKKGILICTDVVARGIDVPAADCIVQYTGPQMDADYLHRVGRTGRAGQSGSAIIFLTHEEQDYVDHLRTHRVFLKKRDQDEYLHVLSIVMEEPNVQQAATALQSWLESAVEKDKALHRSACFAYSTWSRFYNSYPQKMRQFFNFKQANLGHYVTSFALRLTPTQAARVVRAEVSDVEAPRLNKKLANHSGDLKLQQQRRSGNLPRRADTRGEMCNETVSLATAEFSSGMEPLRKRRKQSD